MAKASELYLDSTKTSSYGTFLEEVVDLFSGGARVSRWLLPSMRTFLEGSEFKTFLVVIRVAIVKSRGCFFLEVVQVNLPCAEQIDALWYSLFVS